ncbi:3-((3aS,4S,7aS)-7a-methyl-1,5-dioxo-octahydro-1H- inden-4-yl)propanoate--CoA ligase FadD3 [Planotetraspora phitsanulokensis]|uniref:3-[(3aS,4S,7aS)-7a-methyl-1,5-dioxo-octahydro-1H-inden-4-yl]propanoyl:CoA ligase n=1 Tax=Planotetraspora phitsanulokensis TaxID=575192 RepID=A0A8J3U5C1_9ACTN|nr:FadD3 family acyl-CoA ligase [Planotetraspora phitsanulokensis]GII37441.1 3-[(3aS,4S,7aS)-7a-methyl-1,5-dioxo-octahydro-1H- inden-4-yl]propanoyl:CoA ligase [Planotetraspora phitsanulokensis]
MSDDVALTIPGVLWRAAAEFPDAEAVVDGASRLTYARLRSRVREAAKAFIALGVEPGDRIGIWAPNSLRWIVTALGALSAGAVVVPANTRYKGEEARWLLGRSRVRVLFVADGFLGNGYLGMLGVTADGRAPGLPGLTTVVTYDAEERPGATRWEEFVSAGEAVSDEEADARAEAVRPNDVADVLFTSGTTGRSKGAMCTHRQNVRTYLAWSDRTGLHHGDRYLIVNPLFHSFGYKAGVFACLLRAATMVLQPVFAAGETMRLVEAERITVLPGAPTIYVSMLDAPERERFDLSSLRLAVTGAAVVPVALVARMRAELFPEVVTAYGLTESCGTVTACSLADDDVTVATTSGRPIEGVEVMVTDGAGDPVPEGEDGEILVRGHNVMVGYLDDEEATAETIRDGWLVTGDRGRLDERGNLVITGRSKDMYVVGGFNVYPAEVEQVLAAHEGVAEAAVTGVPDARMGETGRAYVVARPGAVLVPGELVAYCRDRLAGFKMPREVVLVGELPRNAAGKIDKAALAGLTT